MLVNSASITLRVLSLISPKAASGFSFTLAEANHGSLIGRPILLINQRLDFLYALHGFENLAIQAMKPTLALNPLNVIAKVRPKSSANFAKFVAKLISTLDFF